MAPILICDCTDCMFNEKDYETGDFICTCEEVMMHRSSRESCFLRCYSYEHDEEKDDDLS
ncbi:hypothetical protein AOG1_06110 [Geobacter sp. AOG1]|nr:hypothetical protein AOG1_06110 [Geobacter sp. AOG1]